MEKVKKTEVKKEGEVKSSPKFMALKPLYCIHWMSTRYELGKCSQHELRQLYENGFTEFISRQG